MKIRRFGKDGEIIAIVRFDEEEAEELLGRPLGKYEAKEAENCDLFQKCSALEQQLKTAQEQNNLLREISFKEIYGAIVKFGGETRPENIIMDKNMAMALEGAWPIIIISKRTRKSRVLNSRSCAAAFSVEETEKGDVVAAGNNSLQNNLVYYFVVE